MPIQELQSIMSFSGLLIIHRPNKHLTDTLPGVLSITCIKHLRNTLQFRDILLKILDNTADQHLVNISMEKS